MAFVSQVHKKLYQEFAAFEVEQRREMQGTDNETNSANCLADR